MSQIADHGKAPPAPVPTAGTAKARGLPRVPDWVITLLSLVAVIGIWQWYGPGMDPIFAPYPTTILKAFVHMVQTGRLPAAFWASMQPFFTGYLLAAVIGVPVGLLLGRSRLFKAVFGIYVTAGYSTPLIALVPLLMLWCGTGFAVKTLIIFLLTFFPVCINTWIGVGAVPKTLVEVGTAFCASRRKITWEIVVPSTLPYIMAGLRLGIGKAVIAMVIAEFLTAISGLGGVIISSANTFRTADMFVPVIVIMVFAVVLTWLVGLLERRIAPWQNEIAGTDSLG